MEGQRSSRRGHPCGAFPEGGWGNRATSLRVRRKPVIVLPDGLPGCKTNPPSLLRLFASPAFPESSRPPESSLPRLWYRRQGWGVLVLRRTGPTAEGTGRPLVRTAAEVVRVCGTVPVRACLAVAVLAAARRPRQRDAPGQRSGYQQQSDQADREAAHCIPPSPLAPLRPNGAAGFAFASPRSHHKWMDSGAAFSTSMPPCQERWDSRSRRAPLAASRF
jgi:hypothetical protein